MLRDFHSYRKHDTVTTSMIRSLSITLASLTLLLHVQSSIWYFVCIYDINDIHDHVFPSSRHDESIMVSFHCQVWAVTAASEGIIRGRVSMPCGLHLRPIYSYRALYPPLRHTKLHQLLFYDKHKTRPTLLVKPAQGFPETSTTSNCLQPRKGSRFERK